MQATILFLGDEGKSRTQHHELELLPPVGSTLILAEPGTRLRKAYRVSEVVVDIAGGGETTLVVHSSNLGFEASRILSLAQPSYSPGTHFERETVGDFIDCLAQFPTDSALVTSNGPHEWIRLISKGESLILSLDDSVD